LQEAHEVIRKRSLDELSLRYGITYLVLVILSGVGGGAGIYLWDKASRESLRITSMVAEIQEARVTLYRQMKELVDATLLDDVPSRGEYRGYALKIEEHFAALGRISRYSNERAAIKELQRTYRKVQSNADALLAAPVPAERESRKKLFDTELETGTLSEYEMAFEQLGRLFSVRQAALQKRLLVLTRVTPWALGLPIAGAILLLIFTHFFLQRSFVQPLSSLLEATVILSGGNLRHRVPEEGALEMQSLAQAVNKMADELSRSREALVHIERQATLGALVPVVAHNIRNPLASIRAAAQVIDDPALTDDTREELAGIIRCADRLESWTASLLSYLHPLQPQRAPTDLAQLVDEVVDLLGQNIARKALRVERVGWHPAPLLAVDPQLFEQALHGLLLNAVDASPQGAALGLSFSRSATLVNLAIVDHGRGLGFTPQSGSLAPGPSSKRFGTGLGIPFALKVCEIHGGSVKFLQPAGGGTAVVVSLPVDRTGQA
jgi:signal transduction histidine kinase